MCTPEFRGLTTTGLDPNKVFMVLVKFECETRVRNEKEDYGFCVNMKSLINTIHACEGNNVVLYKKKNSEGINIISRNSKEPNYIQYFDIATLNRDNSDTTLRDFLSTVSIHMSLSHIKKIIKYGEHIQSQEINFTIYQDNTTDEIEKTYMVISTRGEMGQARYIYVHDTMYHEVKGSSDRYLVIQTERQEQNSTVNDCPDLEKANKVYSGNFSLPHLSSIVSAMKNDKIEIRLGPDTPLVLTYPLGPGSYASFLLSSKTDE